MKTWEQHIQETHPEGRWNDAGEFEYAHGKLIPVRGRESLQREWVEGGIPPSIRQVFCESVAHLDHRGLVETK